MPRSVRRRPSARTPPDRCNRSTPRRLSAAIRRRPSLVTPAKLLDHRALVRSLTLRAVALLPVTLERTLEFLQVDHLGIEFLDLSRQQPLHLAATFPTASIAEAEQLADLRERQAVGLRLLDESQSLGDRGRIHAKASSCAPSTRHQTDALVVPECIDGQTASCGEFTDLERRVLWHRASLRAR